MATPDSLISRATLILTILFAFLATTAVGLRILAVRFCRRNGRLNLDEYLIISALVFCYGFTIQTIVAGAIGGVGTLRLNELAATSFFPKIEWTEPFLAGPTSALAKLSVTQFYKRIFVLLPRFHLVCNIQMVLVVSWCFIWVFGQLFCARPIDGAWDPQGGHLVFNYAQFSMGIYGACIHLDITTLSLPIFVIKNLHMPADRKVKVTLIFWLGIFCIVAASIRLYYAYKELFVAQAELTGLQAYKTASKTYIWNIIEPEASIVAACLPTYGPLLEKGKFLNTLFGSAKGLFLLRSRSVRIKGGEMPRGQPNQRTFGQGSGSQAESDCHELV